MKKELQTEYWAPELIYFILARKYFLQIFLKFCFSFFVKFHFMSEYVDYLLVLNVAAVIHHEDVTCIGVIFGKTVKNHIYTIYKNPYKTKKKNQEQQIEVFVTINFIMQDTILNCIFIAAGETGEEFKNYLKSKVCHRSMVQTYDD